MSDEAPQVGVLLASPSELQVLQQTGAMLEKFGIPHEIRVMSALRNPDLVDEYARTAEDRGINVIVCGGGLSGHLAGAVAARTVLPVIGVPISSKHHSGSEALYSTAQMPSGVPVATVAVDGAVNAAILAAQIVGVRDEEVRRRLRKFKDDLAEGLKL
jgi:5-(carboxyamino)imidazole ribonucleotide mutase